MFARQQVTYDTSRTARSTVVANINTGDRIRRVVLDDGTVLIDNGAVVDPGRSFSFTTIDFTANGGDNYPFAANGVAFENDPFTITYQEALANLIQSPKANGGLQRLNAADGDEITLNMYGEENAFDLHGRLIDVNVGVAVPGVIKNGTAGRDTLIGTAGDTFVYASLRDAGDTITDFTPYADTIDLTGLLANIGASATTAYANGRVRIVDVTGGASVQIDADGSGPAAARPLVTLRGLTAKQIVPSRDLGL